jgi:citrate lyase synthetase
MKFSEHNVLKENDLDNIPKGSVSISLVMGRFQPINNGHHILFENTLKEYPNLHLLVGIVKGDNTSDNKEDNPLPFALQKNLILKSLTDDMRGRVSVFEKPFLSGYLPPAIEELRKNDYEVSVVVSGEDRKESFVEMIDKINSTNNSIDIIFFDSNDVNYLPIRSTEVRKTIASNDFGKFKTLVPKSLWNYYEEMKEYIWRK